MDFSSPLVLLLLMVMIHVVRSVDPFLVKFSKTTSYGFEGIPYAEEYLGTDFAISSIKMYPRLNHLGGLLTCYSKVDQMTGDFDPRSDEICNNNDRPWGCLQNDCGSPQVLKMSAGDGVKEVDIWYSQGKIDALKVTLYSGNFLSVGNSSSHSQHGNIRIAQYVMVGFHGTYENFTNDIGVLLRFTNCFNAGQRNPLPPYYCKNCASGWSGIYCNIQDSFTYSASSSFVSNLYESDTVSTSLFEGSTRLSSVTLYTWRDTYVDSLEICVKGIRLDTGEWDTDSTEVCERLGSSSDNVQSQNLSLDSNEWITSLFLKSCASTKITSFVLKTNKNRALNFTDPDCSPSYPNYVDGVVLPGNEFGDVIGMYLDRFGPIGLVYRQAPCRNGGTRISPVVCQCTSGFGGVYCTESTGTGGTTGEDITTGEEITTGAVISTTTTGQTATTEQIITSGEATTSGEHGTTGEDTTGKTGGVTGSGCDVDSAAECENDYHTCTNGGDTCECLQFFGSCLATSNCLSGAAFEDYQDNCVAHHCSCSFMSTSSHLSFSLLPIFLGFLSYLLLR